MNYFNAACYMNYYYDTYTYNPETKYEYQGTAPHFKPMLLYLTVFVEVIP